MRCDAPLDSLNVVQSTDEAPKVVDGARILVTVGGQSTFGGAEPSRWRFLSQFSMTKKIGITEVAGEDNLHGIQRRFRAVTEIT